MIPPQILSEFMSEKLGKLVQFCQTYGLLFLRHSVTMDIIHKYRKQPRLNNTVDF